jgi:hypothetical protein
MFSVSFQKSAGKFDVGDWLPIADLGRNRFLQNVLQPAALFLSSHARAFASPSYTVFDSNVKLPKMTLLRKRGGDR